MKWVCLDISPELNNYGYGNGQKAISHMGEISAQFPLISGGERERERERERETDMPCDRVILIDSRCHRRRLTDDCKKHIAGVERNNSPPLAIQMITRWPQALCAIMC